MIKYKKIPNNKNAIKVDGKVILSFDPKYKEYLKWTDKNPDLEQQLVDELEQDIKNKELYNSGAPHTGSNSWRWYNEDGKLGLESEMNGVKKDGEEKAYYDSGNLKSVFEYQNDVIHGKSKNWYDNGELEMEGDFKNGKKDGKCIFYFENGNKKWEGNFKDDVVEGELVQYLDNGSIKSKENFVEGVLEGKYEYYYENGNSRQSGCIINTFKDGEILSYYENGIYASIETYISGIRSGLQKYFYEDGTVSQEGVSKNNLRVGLWTWYWPNGEKLKEEQYVNKTLYRISEWQDDGTEISIKKYNNELLNGKSIFYHHNGNISSAKTYKDGKLYGEYIDYFVSGEERSKGKMYYDKMDGKWTFWYHNKKKELECEFDFGTMIGIAKIYHDNGVLKEVVKL